MSNRLANETSPYLLQHKDNPVDWYPWCAEAFERAKREDKPIFLSIGYSACHWCHVLAHESFEDEEIADLLNRYFISIKVDKEERPDIDSVYMSFCQAFTGSGGWPTSIFMTWEQKPFFAGTYFPKTAKGGMIGLKELLEVIQEKWVDDRKVLLEESNEIIKHLGKPEFTKNKNNIDLTLLAVAQYKRIYDKSNGGFGYAPKFPTPHNLLFLLDYYQQFQTEVCLNMAEKTLIQMYRGGMFDHIGFGFCRYSTDNIFLVPHFEKMLYDNALLILAYCKAYSVTNKSIYLEIAEKTATYILKEMTSLEGGFFSSQDADSEGEEGKYYLFTPQEIIDILGESNGEGFNKKYDITPKGNFEGKNIPNLLKSDLLNESFEPLLAKLYDYRKKRYSLHRDEKILTSWNSLMIAAMCKLYLVSKKEKYLVAAQKADAFIQKYLCDENTLYVSFHSGKRGALGFLDDYAAYIFAQLFLYRTTLEEEYLDRAKQLSNKVISDFGDADGGFYLYGNEHEKLILKPKETYDGAIPSGNSLMSYNLVRLSFLTDDEKYKNESEKQINFMLQNASDFPTSYAMFLKSLLEHRKPPMKITVALDENTSKSKISLSLPPDAVVVLLENPTEAYPLKNSKTTYYVCQEQRCFPPTNSIEEFYKTKE